MIATEQQVNLFEPIFRAERKLFASMAIIVALAITAVALGLMWSFAWRQVRGIEQEIVRLEQAREERMAAIRRTRAGFATDPDVIAARSRDLAAEIARDERVVALIRRGDVGTTTGYSARLAALARPDEGGLWLTRIVFAGRDSALAGGARDAAAIPRYIAAIAEDPAFAGLRVDMLEARAAEAGAGAVEFRIGNGALLEDEQDRRSAKTGARR